MEQDLLAGAYDAVYAAVPKSPTLRRIWHELAEGPDFPEEFGHISFTTLPELERMASELNLSRGDTLVDLGCGMAGPALWMARKTGANLIGVDASRVIAVGGQADDSRKEKNNVDRGFERPVARRAEQ